MSQEQPTPEQLEVLTAEPQTPTPTAAEQRAAEIAAQKAAREAAKAQQEPPSEPTSAKPSPSAPLSDPAKRAQQVIRQIDERQRVRAILEGQRLRMVNALEPLLREAQNEMRRKVATAELEYQRIVERANQDVGRTAGEISALDHSLEQLRRQLAAELGKLDPALAGGKEGV